MIDSHCHLDHEPLFANIPEVLKRSKENGVKKILTICTTIDGFSNIKDILKMDDIIYGTFGIHPHETETNVVDKSTIVKNINQNPKLIGVGETGLDFYYNHSKKNNQIKSFKEHIEAAIDINLPVIVHYFSASGIITFKNSTELQNTFTKIPNDKLLVETDSPFLAPMPMRGKKNEPAFIKYTLKKLSELKGVSEIEMDTLTTNNFETLFFN